MSKILIACYYYPPYAGIGGRRTTKFVKELARKGHEIHILGAENPFEEESVWTAEAQGPGISYHSLPLHYPKALLAPDDTRQNTHSFWYRLRFKLATWYHTRRQPLRIYDPTFQWEKPFLAKVEALLDQYQIPNLWVSVTPHYYSWFAAKLKARRPNLNFIIDFRDPWIMLRKFGMQEMPARQAKREEEIVAETIQQADAIFAPSDYLLDEFEPYRPADCNRIEIVHPYDPEDLAAYLPASQKEADGQIRFVYGGTLYADLAPFLEKLAKSLDHLRSQNDALYKKLKFDFFSFQQHYASIFTAHPGIVEFHAPVGKKIFAEVVKSDYVLIMYAEHNRNFRTTKFFENLPFQRPYLYLGAEGFAAEFIQEKQLGVSFAGKEELEQLTAFWGECEAYAKTFKPGLDYEDFSLARQTTLLESLLR